MMKLNADLSVSHRLYLEARLGYAVAGSSGRLQPTGNAVWIWMTAPTLHMYYESDWQRVEGNILFECKSPKLQGQLTVESLSSAI